MAWIYSGPGPHDSVTSSGSALWLSSETAGAGVATLRDRGGRMSLIITGFEEEASVQSELNVTAGLRG